jgi:phytoene dehydrogenase-like protein
MLGNGYGAAKDAIVEQTRVCIGQHLPRFASSVRLADVATPLTYWNKARSWRGAYEGWMPASGGSLTSHVEKRLRGLHGLYLAGQWVEPGGGVPMAIMSGRQVIQLLCADLKRRFEPPINATRAGP